MTPVLVAAVHAHVCLGFDSTAMAAAVFIWCVCKYTAPSMQSMQTVCRSGLWMRVAPSSLLLTDWEWTREVLKLVHLV
jgi:hypothetical protein